ncbi:MAG: hypothetical protein LBN04_04860 [Oscillospiraceae bacterium]|jgi:hypothetical protein|nr:hypothetical protein [Oscillospiraceae bacterium]
MAIHICGKNAAFPINIALKSTKSIEKPFKKGFKSNHNASNGVGKSRTPLFCNGENV